MEVLEDSHPCFLRLTLSDVCGGWCVPPASFEILLLGALLLGRAVRRSVLLDIEASTVGVDGLLVQVATAVDGHQGEVRVVGGGQSGCHGGNAQDGGDGVGTHVVGTHVVDDELIFNGSDVFK